MMEIISRYRIAPGAASRFTLKWASMAMARRRARRRPSPFIASQLPHLLRWRSRRRRRGGAAIGLRREKARVHRGRRGLGSRGSFRLLVRGGAGPLRVIGCLLDAIERRLKILDRRREQG